jgi:hypothetical protein
MTALAIVLLPFLLWRAFRLPPLRGWWPPYSGEPLPPAKFPSAAIDLAIKADRDAATMLQELRDPPG